MCFNPVPLTLSTLSFLGGLFHTLILDASTDTYKAFSKIKSRMANSVDPDETAHYEPSHQDIHCLHRYRYWSVGMKGLII